MFKIVGDGDKQSASAVRFSGSASPFAPASAPATSHRDRRDVLHRISNFLLDHALAINPGNLALAQSIVAGEDVALGRRIEARRGAGQPITQAWLDDAAGASCPGEDSCEEPERRDEPHRLIGRLDRSLRQFSQYAGAARDAAADYGAALAETAAGLDALRPVVELSGLTRLTRGMIGHVGILEAEMRRCEAEAASLRQSLKAAPDAAIGRPAGPDGRRAFAAALEREVAAAHAATAPLSVAFCDIDGVRTINDAHGVDTGNRVIQAIARVLQRISGRNCHAAGHGDEDFVLLFRGLSPDRAGHELDQAREDFAQRKLIDRRSDAAIGNVTFSGGVADVFAYDTPGAALRAADEALAQAKGQGRNRIVVAGAPPGASCRNSLPRIKGRISRAPSS